jgi:hypothetical protein
MSVLSDPHRFRQTVAGVCLIAAPLAGFISCLSDSDEGTGDPGSKIYAAVSANASGIHTTALVFMLSAILTVPMALGIAHLLRGRGSTLGNLGAAALGLGAFAHFGYGLWHLMISRAAGLGDQPNVIAYLDRMSSAALLLLPGLFLVDVGIALLAVGLLRARTVPLWVPWLIVAAMVADLGLQFAGFTATWPITALWGVLTVAFGFIGLRVLAMPAAVWAGQTAAAPQREPVTV